MRRGGLQGKAGMLPLCHRTTGPGGLLQVFSPSMPHATIWQNVRKKKLNFENFEVWVINILDSNSKYIFLGS
jgi:hypothetical protein